MGPFEGIAQERRAVQQRVGKGSIRQRPLRYFVLFESRPRTLGGGGLDNMGGSLQLRVSRKSGCLPILQRVFRRIAQVLYLRGADLPTYRLEVRPMRRHARNQGVARLENRNGR
jgi:hypothetical protein